MVDLRILHYPAPVLLEIGKPVESHEFGQELSETADKMFQLMYEAGGVGLAAPQVGISKRFFIMDVPEQDSERVKAIIINPQIAYCEGEQVGDEGCLSFPGIYQTVSRQMRVIVKGQDLKGNEIELDVKGLAARCVLHETDHCDGIVFIDRVSALKRELAKRKIAKLRKTGKWEAVI
jgi:peptide deformylase